MSLDDHEIIENSVRGFGSARVTCSCGSTFLSTRDWQTHAEQSQDNLTVDGPGMTVARACGHLIGALGGRTQFTVTERRQLQALADALKGADL